MSINCSLVGDSESKIASAIDPYKFNGWDRADLIKRIGSEIIETLGKTQFSQTPLINFESHIGNLRFRIISTLTCFSQANEYTISKIRVEPQGIDFNQTPGQGTEFFSFTYELKEGIKGNRAPDHHIDLLQLVSCLRKKKPQLKKARDKNEIQTLDFYFKTGSKALDIVVKYFPNQEKPYQVFTAYMMDRSMLKGRIGKATFEQWFSELPQIPKVRVPEIQREEKEEKGDEPNLPHN